MARRTRSFLFDNISKRLVQNTNKTSKEINNRRVANTTANTDILTKAEVQTVVSNTGINTLSDISIASVANEQVLQYNANTAKWENETLSLVSSVDGLTDTNLTSLSNGDYLVYNSSGSEWINRSLDLSSYVTDTEIADYSNTAQMNTAIAASNTALKSYVDTDFSNTAQMNTAIAASNTLMTTYVDDQVANVDFSAYSTTTQMNTAIASSNTAMKNYVDAEVAGIVNSAPAALDTLNELAAALGDDANFSTTTSTALGNRLRIDVSNQSLTGTQQTNALTNLGITASLTEINKLDGVTASTTEINKLDGVTASTTELNYLDGVTSNIQTQLDSKGTSSFSGSYNDLSNKPTIPTNNNQLTNGAGYITSSSLSSYATSTDLTDGTITKINSQATIGDSIEFFLNDGGGNLGMRFNANYNTSVEDGSAWEFQFNNDSTSGDFLIYYDGSISAADEAITWVEGLRLDGGDSQLYVFGDKVWDAGNLTNLNQLTNGPGYITGITSSMVTTALGYTPGTSNFNGAYSSLTGKPTIPTNNNQLTNGAGYITSTSASTLTVGDGSSTASHIAIKSADDAVAECLQFYNGTTRVGEIGTEDTTWLRINQETAKNIYTPRYIRADGGFFIDGTAKGLDGSGNLIGGMSVTAGAGSFTSISSSGSITGNDLRTNRYLYAATDTNTYIDMQVAADTIRVVTGGGEVFRVGVNYMEFQDNDTLRLGAGSDFRMWHDGTNHYFRNYNHAGGNIYWQGEDTEGSNHALLYMYTATSRPYVSLYENGAERLRTVNAGINVYGTLTTSGLTIGRVTTTSDFHNANDAGSFSARGDTTKPALMSFHRAGAYAFQFGLDTDNHLKMGGWSIGTATPHMWKNNGDYSATGNICAYSSDARLKTNVVNIENALEKLMSLNGVTFDWKEEVKDLGFEPTRMYNEAGVLAQEVEAVLPQATAPAPFDVKNEDGKHVSKSGENYLTVQYEKIVPLLIEAMKEQQQQIEDLKEIINGTSK